MTPRPNPRVRRRSCPSPDRPGPRGPGALKGAVCSESRVTSGQRFELRMRYLTRAPAAAARWEAAGAHSESARSSADSCQCGGRWQRHDECVGCPRQGRLCHNVAAPHRDVMLHWHCRGLQLEFATRTHTTMPCCFILRQDQHLGSLVAIPAVVPMYLARLNRHSCPDMKRAREEVN